MFMLLSLFMLYKYTDAICYNGDKTAYIDAFDNNIYIYSKYIQNNEHLNIYTDVKEIHIYKECTELYIGNNPSILYFISNMVIYKAYIDRIAIRVIQVDCKLNDGDLSTLIDLCDLNEGLGKYTYVSLICVLIIIIYIIMCIVHIIRKRNSIKRRFKLRNQARTYSNDTIPTLDSLEFISSQILEYDNMLSK